MPYYRDIKTPVTRRDGLANFVQMIINKIEAGETREALLTAVDLHQDIETGVYDDAMIDAKAINTARAEMEGRIIEAHAAGRALGVSEERARIGKTLGLTEA